jgi:hypothetical protein
MVVLALEPRKAKVGALLAYPDDGPDDGHIGIVTAIGDSDEGRATQVVHGAPGNYLLPAAPGQRHATPRHATPFFPPVPHGCSRLPKGSRLN